MYIVGWERMRVGENRKKEENEGRKVDFYCNS